jgi:4,5-dihydroxyphthalate decarboxylase
MTKLRLSIGISDYDRIKPLKEGLVQVEGCDPVVVALQQPEAVFHTAYTHQEFDVCELSFSSTILQTARGNCPYVPIPVFLSRVFRHSGIYVRADSGIRKPEDLKGKIVGVPEYQMTAALWIRGMLSDEYGVKPADIKWRNGGLENPGREEKFGLQPPGIELKAIPHDRTLNDMLDKGELPAVITARAPSCYDGEKIVRLFPDYKKAEQQYYAKTKLFPIMHVVGVRRTLLEQYPWVAASLLKAFAESKQRTIEKFKDVTALFVTMPWIGAELEETRALMGEDFWPYGVAANHHTVDAMCRYSFEQGLSPRRVKVEELFAPSTYEEIKI